MPKKPSSIPANILALIPAEEKGCSVYENKARGVYYVFRRIISCQNSLPLKLNQGEAENELFRRVQSISC